MTTNIFLTELAKRLKIPNFRGVFMRDEISKLRKTNFESGIMNFDTSDKPGSHWVCWFINKTCSYYFDSYGTAVPDELRDYIGGKIFYSDFMLQNINTDICGDLCMAFIYCMCFSDRSYEDIILQLNSISMAPW